MDMEEGTRDGRAEGEFSETKGGKWSVKGAARGKGAKYPTKNMATESATESRRHSWKIEQVFARTV